VVTVFVQPERLDEVIAVVRDSIWPAAKQEKGHGPGLLLVDRQTGKAISIALWETEADMIAGETSPYLREQMGKIVSAFTAAPIAEHYEVSLAD